MDRKAILVTFVETPSLTEAIEELITDVQNFHPGVYDVVYTITSEKDRQVLITFSLEE